MPGNGNQNPASREAAAATELIRSLSIEDIIDIVRRLPPEFAPGAGAGTEAHYGDTNYALLGAIIEAVTTTKVAGSFQEMVFTPLVWATPTSSTTARCSHHQPPCTSRTVSSRSR